jgi:hypothetical protein
MPLKGILMLEVAYQVLSQGQTDTHLWGILVHQ